MKRPFIFGIILIILLISVVIYFFIKKDDQGVGSEKNVKYYPINIAKLAAEDNLPAFENWRSPQISETFTMYDTHNNPSAYLFVVRDYYGKAGYLIISATDKTTPLIELSKSDQTPYTNLITVKSFVAQEERRTPFDIKAQLIYLGSKEYLAQFEIQEGSDIKILYYLLSESNLSNPISLGQEELLQRENFYNLLQQPQTNKTWEKYLK